jgi:hypothetical protein
MLKMKHHSLVTCSILPHHQFEKKLKNSFKQWKYVKKKKKEIKIVCDMYFLTRHQLVTCHCGRSPMGDVLVQHVTQVGDLPQWHIT